MALLLKQKVRPRFLREDLYQLPGTTASSGEKSRVKDETLLMLAYKAHATALFAQPMVQAYFMERWISGDDPNATADEHKVRSA